MYYFSWNDGCPVKITRKQFVNLVFFIDNVLPPFARSFISKKRFKNDVAQCVVTHIYFENILILSTVRCF